VQLFAEHGWQARVQRAERSQGVSEFKFVSAFGVSPGSVIFSRSVASGEFRSAGKATSVSVRKGPTETKLPKRSSDGVALRRVVSAFECQLRTVASPSAATFAGRSSTPKSVLNRALLKARRAARADLFSSIASRLAALKVPSSVELRPVALRKRPRFLS
jgi:hypothetical protein